MASLTSEMEDQKKKIITIRKDDELEESLKDLSLNMSTLIKSQLQGCNVNLELLEKMNARVSQEYNSFADLASGLRVFVQQLNAKSCANYDHYVHRINAIEQQLTRFEALVASLDRHVSALESNLYASLLVPPTTTTAATATTTTGK